MKVGCGEYSHGQCIFSYLEVNVSSECQMKLTYFSRILCFHEFWVQPVDAVTGPANKPLVGVAEATGSLQPGEQTQDWETMARSRSLFIVPAALELS